jgi:hypothetical protein
MIRGTPLPMATTAPQATASRTPAAGNNLMPFDPLAGVLPAVPVPCPAGVQPSSPAQYLPSLSLLPESATAAVSKPLMPPLPAQLPSATPVAAQNNGVAVAPGPSAHPAPPPSGMPAATQVSGSVVVSLPSMHPSPSPSPSPSANPAAMQDGGTDAAPRPEATWTPHAPGHPRPGDACFPLPSAHFDPPVLELHVEHAGGRIEVLSLPWRLAPSGTLSQRHDDLQAGVHAIASSASQAFAEARVGQGARSPLSMLPEAVLAPPGDADGHAIPVAPRASMPVADATDDDPLSHARQAAPQAQPWLERLYRWAERAGADPSLWVRDYRLGPEQARDLASALQSLARERGVALRRIVVNGREAWHAAAPASARVPHRIQED